MTTQQVTYCTLKKLYCCPIQEVILCVPTVVTANESGFMDATMIAVTNTTVCGQCKYTYTFEYDDEQLANPATPLVGAEISGVICKDCLIDWIIWYVGGPVPPVT